MPGPRKKRALVHKNQRRLKRRRLEELGFPPRRIERIVAEMQSRQAAARDAEFGPYVPEPPHPDTITAKRLAAARARRAERLGVAS